MKKIIILLFLILPLGLFAQDAKIAIVRVAEITPALPEFVSMQNQLEELNQMYEKELKQMQDEYTNKYTSYVEQQETLTENIKIRRMQEIEQIRERIDNFLQAASQDVQQKQQDLYAPIQQKVFFAINSVGSEKGYTYILVPEALLYVGANAIDATPFVKSKLGLQ